MLFKKPRCTHPHMSVHDDNGVHSDGLHLDSFIHGDGDGTTHTCTHDDRVIMQLIVKRT